MCTSNRVSMRIKYLHLGLQLIQINCGITVHCELLWQLPMIAPNASMDAQVNVTHPGSNLCQRGR